MKQLPQISSICSTPRRKLCLAIAAQMMLSAGVKAAPIGGTIVGGDGSIDHAGLNTTIIQNSDRLAVDWESFNIAAEERVQFIQPDSSSVALNRILGNEASQIFGRLDANGHVILMNPNGVLFGENATVNVGGLVASGLSINANDFMNGDFVLRAIDGTEGTVINRGIINAATGGNVALIGRQVDNQGLISAKLGSVNLAAGKEAVLTFDNEGLLGVRVAQEILQSELGVEAAVSNSGDITAEGGRILLTGSVSQDIFSQAVNSDGLNVKTSVVMHEDGSFTLGAGADVVNTGTLNTSSNTSAAGQIVVLGENINNSGAILANNKTANAAGNIEIHSRNTTLVTEQSQISATNDGAGSGGQIKILGDRVGVLDQSHINASGTNGGGDINIGGGFQGKETQLRNATRTVVGKDALIEANAITEGDGGDVIVWADQTTSFTGEINARGGELGGDGGFVEVSGKENLRFLGSVDRTAVRGKNGTLLLGQEQVIIASEALAAYIEDAYVGGLSDGDLLHIDEPGAETPKFLMRDTAISGALATGDVILNGSDLVGAYENDARIVVEDPNSRSSLVLESGGSVYLANDTRFDLGGGDFVAVGSIESRCLSCAVDTDITLLAYATVKTDGNIYLLSNRSSVFHQSTIGTNQIGIPNNIYMYSGGSTVFSLDADFEIGGSIKAESLDQPTLTSIELPSGAIYEIPELKKPTETESKTVVLSTASILGRKAEVTVGEGLFVDTRVAGGTVDLSGIIVNASNPDAQFLINSQDAVHLPQIGYDLSGNPSSTSISVNVSSNADIFAEENIYTVGGSLALSAGNLNFGDSTTLNTTGGVRGQGDILLETVGDITLGQFSSGGALEIRSLNGEIISESALDIQGNAFFEAGTDIRLSQGFSLNAGGDVRFLAEYVHSSAFFADEQIISTAGALFYESSGGLHLRGVYDADSLDITSGGDFAGGDVEVNVSKDIKIDLGSGTFHGISGYMFFNAGSFSVEAAQLLMGDVIINTDVAKGSGEINLIASGSSPGYDIWLPAINPGGLFTTGNLLVQAFGSVISGISVSGGEQLLGYSNLSGSVQFDVGGDLYLPEINVTNPQGDRDFTLNVGGTLYQNYDLFTGGANYFATAEEFVFGEGVKINTDFSNETQDALFGAGNISIHAASNQAELKLPGIRTQANCLGTSNCGTLSVSAVSVTNTGPDDFIVSGDANFDVVESLQLTLGPVYLPLDSAVNEVSSIGGFLSINASAASVFSPIAGTLILGEINIEEGFSIGNVYRERGANIIANRPLKVGDGLALAGDYIELKNPESIIPSLILVANSVDIEYSGDLNLFSANFRVGESEIASRFTVSGNFSASNYIYTRRPDELAGGRPIILDVGGNIQLMGESNELSSIQIFNAQNVDIFNIGDLTLDGVNAGNLSLNILGDIIQSDAINVAGETSIIAAPGSNIDFSNPLNDFNFLNVESTGTSVINIADSGAITLSNINLDGTGQGGELSVTAASIIQAESSGILLQDSAQLNLIGDFITLGANGTSTVDIAGAVLNGVFTNDLNIQGTIRGAAGVADPRLAGIYIDGSAADNFVEIAAGASISGDFRAGSSIAMGDGNDIANIAGDVAISIEGGAGQDTFTIAPNISVAQIIGGEDLDTLNGPDASNVWTIGENGEGTVTTGSASNLFSGIERINGGNASDEFIIESASVALEIDGGEGLDRLTANPNDASINNQWILDGINSGSLNELLLFSSVESLIGNDGADNVTFVEGAQIGEVSTGLGDDVFTVAANVTAGLLDGGGGQNTLNSSGLNLIYTYLNELTDSDADYTSVNFDFHNNEGGSKTIVGVNGYDAEWIIDDDGSVIISATQGGVTETNRFTGVTRVQGASGNDTFILQGGYIADRIIGGQGGTDTLIADTGLTNNEWSINGVNSGKVRIADADREQLFEAINNLVGGAGDDVFNISNGAAFIGSINGRAGTNSLAILDSEASSVWTIASSNNVRIESSGDVASQITFSEIQTLIGNENEDVLDLSAVAGSVDLENQSAVGFAIQNFDNFVSNGGTLQGADRSSVWNLDETSSVSYIDSNGILREQLFTGFQIIRAGDESDTFFVNGRWFSGIGSIEAFSESETVDRIEFNIADTDVVWNFNSASTHVYLDVDTKALFEMSRNDIPSALGIGAEAFSLYGFEEYIGGEGSDAFFVYADAEEHKVVIDGRGGNDFLSAWNWGVPQDIVWNINRDFGGDINSKLDFSNIENLKSGDFLDTRPAENFSYFNVSDGVSITTLVGDALDTTFNIGLGAIIGSISDNGGTDTLNVAGGSNTWQLTESGGQLNSTVFTGIEILNGGSGADDFILSSSTTSVTQINGGDGVNSLTAFDQANLWDISSSGSTLNSALRFVSITNLVGGSAVDSFIVNTEGHSLVIDGGNGANQFLVNTSQDLVWQVNSNDIQLSAPQALLDILLSNIQVLDVDSSKSTFYVNDLDNQLDEVKGSSLAQHTFDFSRIEGDLSLNLSSLPFGIAAFDRSLIIGNGSQTEIVGDEVDTGWVIHDDFIEAISDVAWSPAFENIGKIQGGSADDEFQVLTLNNVIEIDGGAGVNRLITGVSQNTFNINAASSGTLNDNVIFSGIQNIEGGAGNDTFVFAPNSSIGNINAGAGDDSFILANNITTGILDGGEGNDTLDRSSLNFVVTYLNELLDGDAVYAAANIETETTTGGSTTVVGVDGYNAQWTISGEGSLSVRATGSDGVAVANQFTGVTRAEGRSGTDDFILLEGGALAEGIFGNGNDSLQASNTSNNWRIDSENGGALTVDESTTLLFQGIANLIGGSGSDIFNIATGGSITGSIDGGAGADRLVISDASVANQWQLGTANSVAQVARFQGIETITGNSGDDTFAFTGASDVTAIEGGDGNNTLLWSAGDLAVNLGTGLLNEEILFSGISTFDADAAANNTLTGADAVNSWSIDGDAAGTVSNANGSVAFSGFQTLIGGAEADTFTLAAGVNLSEIYGGAGNDVFVIGEGVVADNFYGEAGDDSFDVEVGLVLSGVLDGGTGGEVEGDYINLSKYTLLNATADLETVLGFAFRNFERIDRPNNQGVYFGGDGTNFWYITGANQGRLEIREGENAGVYEFSGVHSLRGGTGEDIFIFANDMAAITTLIDGGEGAGANTLDLSAQGLVNQWLLDGANSGRVSNGSNAGGNIFTNIAYLIGGSAADRFELHAGGSIAGAIDGGLGNNELMVAVEQTSNWRLGEAGGHSVTGVASFSNIETLIGGAGSDSFDIFADLTDISRINGGAGSDAVNFRYDAPISVDLARGLAAGLLVEGIERFTSLNALSTLIGVDAESTWTVDGANAGSVRYLLATGEDAINVAFDGFGNLAAGADDDRFVFAQGGALSGTLDGGAGRNAVDLQGLANDVHVATAAGVALPTGVARLNLTNMDELIGNDRTWLYGASDRSYTWTIDGARSGRVTSTLVDDDNRLLAFENLSAIRGGAHDDIFQVTVATPLLSLDGGGAVTADLVDYSQVNGNLRINVAEALSGQNGVITGIEGIRGNNAGPDSLHTAELIGPDGGAIWRIGNFGGLADGVNDGEVAFGDQTISFLDFNLLTGGAGNDTFNQTSGVVLGVLNGGAGNDTFNIDLAGSNTGTRVIGGAGTDTLLLRGGEADGVMTYTAAANGGEFDYGFTGEHYKVSHQEVETLLDQSLAETLEIRGSSLAETFALGNGQFQVNGGDAIEYRNKRDIAVRTGINDIIDIAANLQVASTLTLANGTVTANDPANASISTPRLVLDSVRDVGLASARLRTSVDNLQVLNSVGDIYLQEQNGLNLAEFNANGVFDLLLLNGDLNNSAPLYSADVFRVSANNGDITLTGANQLRDDVALTGQRVELHNATTLTLMEVNAEELILRTQRGIEGDGPVVVSGLTSIDAQGDVIFDFATNDFNKVRVTNAVNLTLVDQNALDLLDINASGAVVIRSTNNLTLTDQVTGGNGVSVSSGNGSVNQNGNITTSNGAVLVSAGNGEVNLDDDARIVANGGSVNINAGAGDVNMGDSTRIVANGGDVNIVAADSVVVAEVVSSGLVTINAGTGGISDGNGGATNVTAGGLQSSANTGFGNQDALETEVGNINISTNSGDVAVSNKGNVTVDGVSTGQGDITLVNQGNVELGAGSISAQDGANGGSVDISVSQGSVSQSGSTNLPAVKGTGTVVISAPDGAIGSGGGLRVDAPAVEIIAAIKAGEIFVNPGADKIEYFSGSFKFDDQLLAIAPLEDINPAIFANVKSYSFNDISVLLPRDQRYEDDEEEK